MLRRIVLRGAFLMQLPRLMRHFHRDRLVILMYHGFTTAAPRPGVQNLDGNHVHVEKFARQVEYLSTHHNIVSLHEVVESIGGGPPLPPYPVVLTMDDGYRSTYTLALPVLRRFGARAALFVTTGFVDEHQPLWPDRVEYALDGAAPEIVEMPLAGVDWVLDFRTAESRRRSARCLIGHLKRIPEEGLEGALAALEGRLGRALRDATPWPEHYRPLSWEEIRAMAATGLVSVGNHTHRHRILARCTPETQRREVERAHELLVKHLEKPCDLFCYPNGTVGDYDDVTKGILHDLGYVCSPTTTPGANGLTPDPFELRRVALNDRATFDDFLTILYGGLHGLTRDLAAWGGRRNARA